MRIDRTLIRSYINAPDEVREYIKQAIKDAVAAWEKAQAGVPEFTEEELAVYEKVKQAKERSGELTKKESWIAGESFAG